MHQSCLTGIVVDQPVEHALRVTPLQGSLISTAVGLAVVMIGVLIDQAKAGGGKQPAPAPAPQVPQTQQRPAKRTSWGAAIVITLLLCGGGGLAATYAGHWVVQQAVAAVERVTGEDKDNPGRERLGGPRTKTQGILTVTVTSVQVNERATVVKLTARNSGQVLVTMSGGRGEQLNVPDHGTLRRDQFTGDWNSGDVPAKGESSGTIVFDGKIPPGATSATLSFPMIFSMGGVAPENMSIDLPLLIEATPTN